MIDETLVIPIPLKDLQELIKTIEETTASVTVRDDPEAYVKRGILKNKYFLYEGGAQDLAKAMQIDPFCVPGYVNMAMVEQYIKTLENGQKFVQMFQAMCGAFKP